MTAAVLALAIPWVVVLAITPRAEAFARRRGLLDRPHAHKMHASPVPHVGGLVVFAAAFLGLVAGLVALAPDPTALFALLANELGELPTVVVLIAAVVAVGAYDDRHDLSARTRLAVQVSIGVASWCAGLEIGRVELAFGWTLGGAPAVSMVMTIGWIVALTNAFNFIDGMDGLASGVGLITLLTLLVLGAGAGSAAAAWLCLPIAGALAGLLRFNLPPARIFLGDAGSTGLGYTIAVLSILSFQKSSTAMVVAVPLLVAGVPVIDASLAVARRMSSQLRLHGARGLRPWHLARALARADRSHVHHLLLRSGWSVPHALCALYLAAVSLAVLAVAMRTMDSTSRWAIALLVLVGGVVLLRRVERHVTRVEARRSASGPAVGSTAALSLTAASSRTPETPPSAIEPSVLDPDDPRPAH